VGFVASGKPVDMPLLQLDLEHLLDYGPWTGRQKLIILLAAMTIVLDGMDIQMMGFAIPSIAASWHVARSAFANVLGLGLLGVMLGTIGGGLFGDRYGRRTALLISVSLFASTTLLTSLADSVTAVLLLRFVAGLGIGAALPNAATMAAEYTPLNRRPLAVTLTIVCIPLGGLIAGLIATHVLLSHSWRILFAIGGILPLLLIAVLWMAMPESARFLAKDPRRMTQLRRLLHIIGRPIPPNASLRHDAQDGRTHKVSLKEIFADGLLSDTIALWGAFFFCLTTVYLAFNWLPSVLVGGGLSPVQAGNGLSYYNLGGIFGALSFGIWINMTGSRLPMLFGSALGVLSALLVTRMMHHALQPSPSLFAMIAIHGLFVNAVQTSLYAIATQLYATRIRSTGVASALALGRMGAIFSALFGGFTLRLAPGRYFAVLAFGMGCVFVTMLLFKRHIHACKVRME
jgi:AAHS family 4-hydroxybenzoate transporter-like MFS transporter